MTGFDSSKPQGVVMTTQSIPFLDLNSLHAENATEYKEVFEQALATGRFIGGPQVTEFENEFAQFCDAQYCVGVGSGTDAVRFALMASGVELNDIVITVPNTFIATTESITQVGADIVFVDIDEKTYNLSPEKLQNYLENECELKDGTTYNKNNGKRVKAVVPVHLYGQVADMDAIMDIAEKYGLIVVEDACQAHGATYFSKKQNKTLTAGSIGKAAAFSFYPGKNLGAFGEGGAVTTNDESIANIIKKIRDHGQAQKYIHDIEGYNGRLDAIQAGVLRIKLRNLPKWNEQRIEAARKYTELFSSVDSIIAPVELDGAKPVYHLYVIRVKNRDQLQKKLSEVNIGTGLHYPIPLHLQEAYTQLGYKTGDFPVTEVVAEELLSMPMFPGLSESQVERVVSSIKELV